MTLTSGTKLDGKHTTVVIRRHVAIRIYEPKVVTYFLSPRTAERIIDKSCGFIRTCIICTRYMIIGMDYHIEQVPMCCRVCEQRLWKSKAKQKIIYECNAYIAALKIAQF